MTLSQVCIYHFLLDVSITNAFILSKGFSPHGQSFHTQQQTVVLRVYSLHHTALNTILQFRLQLARELIGEYCSRKRAGRVTAPARTLSLQHFPLKLNKDGKTRRGRCAHCQKAGRRTDTSWHCEACKACSATPVTQQQTASCSSTETWSSEALPSTTQTGFSKSHHKHKGFTTAAIHVYIVAHVP